jgi:hypothetical protein
MRFKYDVEVMVPVYVDSFYVGYVTPENNKWKASIRLCRPILEEWFEEQNIEYTSFQHAYGYTYIGLEQLFDDKEDACKEVVRLFNSAIAWLEGRNESNQGWR